MNYDAKKYPDVRAFKQKSNFREIEHEKNGAKMLKVRSEIDTDSQGDIFGEKYLGFKCMLASLMK